MYEDIVFTHMYCSYLYLYIIIINLKFSLFQVFVGVVILKSISIVRCLFFVLLAVDLMNSSIRLLLVKVLGFHQTYFSPKQPEFFSFFFKLFLIH